MSSRGRLVTCLANYHILTYGGLATSWLHVWLIIKPIEAWPSYLKVPIKLLGDRVLRLANINSSVFN